MVGLFTNCGGGNDPQGANLFIEVPQSDGMQLDIYIEAHYDYYGTAAYYGDHFSNERVSVNLKANDWARLDTEGNDHNGIMYRAVQGSGDIQ